LASVLLSAFACGERITAPGACPTFCPDDQIVVLDTLLLDGVVQDSTFTGFLPAYSASVMQLVNEPGGVEAVALARFVAFSDSLPLSPVDTLKGPIVATDSFRLDIPIARRAATIQGLQIAIHRMPAGVDTLTVYDAVAPFFHDSTVLDTLDVPDTLSVGRFLAVLPGDAFPNLDADGRLITLGFRLIAPEPTYLELGAVESTNAVILTRFTKVDSAGTQVFRNEGRLPGLDTYFATADVPAPPGALVVGGIPSARAFLRLAVPSAIVDSSTVVRATLILVPVTPVVGPPGDTLILLGAGISADVGAKSPLVGVPADSVAFRVGRVAVGSTDTLRLDVTDLVRSWRANPTRPRVIVVRAVPEGGSLSAAALGSSLLGGAPILQVTWIPPVTLGDR
jgi:hypothetical protein